MINSSCNHDQSLRDIQIDILEHEQEKLQKKPKPYSKEQIDTFLTTFRAEDFIIFNEEIWVTLVNRKCHKMKKYKQRKLKLKPKPQLNPQPITDPVEIERDIKFKLNQLAPDNFNKISKIIIEYLVNNHDLAPYIAQRIIEKSQLEQKYRFVYTKLCASMVNEPRLQITADQQIKANNFRITIGPIFKIALLNGVQAIFENRVNNLKEDLSHMASEQRESFKIQRKNKFIGSIRFIGELYLQKILPRLAVQVVIRDLLQVFLSSSKPEGDNLEESLEGLIELLDQIGSQYKVQYPIDAKQQMQAFFNGQPIEQKELNYFCNNLFSQFIPLDNLFQIFDLLIANYNLSSRLSILYENLLDRKRNGWKEIIHQKGGNAKSVKQLQDEYDKEQDQQSQNNRPSHGGSIRHKQQQQTRQQNVDLIELAQYVALTFKCEGDEQADKLKDEIKRHSNNEAAQTVIFESFFTLMLKPSKAHLEKSQIVYELLSLQESNSNSIKKGLNMVNNSIQIFRFLAMKIIYMIWLMHQLGLTYRFINITIIFVGIICYFITENDFQNLEKLQIKPAIYVEDYYIFLAKVMSKLENKFPEIDIKRILNNYLKKLNITEIIVE